MGVIITEELQKTYGSVTALNGVSLSVQPGEAVALIGENGSGKTTLINTILGLTAPDAPPRGGVSRLLGEKSDKLTLEHRQKIGCISDSCSPITPS